MMTNLQEKQEIISNHSTLMEEIMEVRYTDMDEEKRLCKRLLEISERDGYFYGSAFANVYLLDSHLALGEYSSCDFYLLRARVLCQEYGFDDLMLALCNCAGLYYQKLNDDRTALSYFLEGEQLAEKLEDIAMMGKIYNNIGYSFARNGDIKTGRDYFQKAYETVEHNLGEDNIWRAITYLSNLAEMCWHLRENEEGAKALTLCEELSKDDVYTRIRVACSWCSYYILTGDKEWCIRTTDRLMEEDFPLIKDPFFVCDMAEGLCGNMLALGDLERAKGLLDMMDALGDDISLSVHYRMQCLKIRYLEACEGGEELWEAYRDYYEIASEVAAIEAETRAQSMISKIQINQVMVERDTMQRTMSDLENSSQLDELTGLYNRRYFNKLLSKIIQSTEVKTLGFVMLDVDYFKQYNDFYGHFKGDSALQAVAEVLSLQSREGIHASRYGGDEFVSLCVNQTDEEMEVYTQALIDGLAKKQIPHEENQNSPYLTISIGYSNELFKEGVAVEQVLNLADQALYAVKISHRGGAKRL